MESVGYEVYEAGIQIRESLVNEFIHSFVLIYSKNINICSERVNRKKYFKNEVLNYFEI